MLARYRCGTAHFEGAGEPRDAAASCRATLSNRATRAVRNGAKPRSPVRDSFAPVQCGYRSLKSGFRCARTEAVQRPPAKPVDQNGRLRRGRGAANSTAWKANRSRACSRTRASRSRHHRCRRRSAACPGRNPPATATGNTKAAAPIFRSVSRHRVRCRGTAGSIAANSALVGIMPCSAPT